MLKFVINKKLEIELLNVNFLLNGWVKDEKEKYHLEKKCFDSKEEAEIYLKNFLNKEILRLGKLLSRYQKIYTELEGKK